MKKAGTEHKGALLTQNFSKDVTCFVASFFKTLFQLFIKQDLKIFVYYMINIRSLIIYYLSSKNGQEKNTRVKEVNNSVFTCMDWEFLEYIPKLKFVNPLIVKFLLRFSHHLSSWIVAITSIPFRMGGIKMREKLTLKKKKVIKGGSLSIETYKL